MKQATRREEGRGGVVTLNKEGQHQGEKWLGLQTDKDAKNDFPRKGEIVREFDNKREEEGG